MWIYPGKVGYCLCIIMRLIQASTTAKLKHAAMRKWHHLCPQLVDSLLTASASDKARHDVAVIELAQAQRVILV